MVDFLKKIKNWLMYIGSIQNLEISFGVNRRGQKKRKLPKRLLYLYKKKSLHDHELYSMVAFLKSNFEGVEYVCFSHDERPRHNPGLSTKKLRMSIDQYKPDMIFAYDNMLNLEEAAMIKKKGIALASNTCGVHSYLCGGMTQKESLETMRNYTWYLVPHRPHIERLRNEGVNAIEFPLWYDSNWFRPLGLKNKKWDIFFIGDVKHYLNKNRTKLLEMLGKKFSVIVASTHDPQIKGIQYIGATANPYQLNRWLNAARIVIGSDKLADPAPLNAADDQYIFYDDTYFIRQRTYLMLGAGSCYVVERHAEIERQFVDEKEIVLWGSEEELVQKIGYYLVHDNDQKRVGLSAHKRALAEHSTNVRVKQLLTIMGLKEG